MSLTVEEFWKSVNIWRSYGQDYGILVFFLTHSVVSDNEGRWLSLEAAAVAAKAKEREDGVAKCVTYARVSFAPHELNWTTVNKLT